MSTTVTYKGNTLTTVSNATKTLKTAGKYMEDDVQLTDTTSTIVISETTDSHGGIIKTITTTDEVNLQVKTINPTTSTQTVNPDTGYDGFSQVIVGAGSGSINNQNKTVTPTTSQQQITADSGYSGLGTVTVNAIPSQYIVPSGNKEITANGTGIDVTQYATVSVNVPTGGGDTINNQDKTVTPTESQQTITADEGYTGLGTVTVNAISNTYVGSGIDRRDATDLIRTVSETVDYTLPAGYYENDVEFGFRLNDSNSVQVSGATIVIPSGWYENQVTKSVASGSATGPSSLSGSSATITTGTDTITLTKTDITTTPTVSAGYISSATASTATVALTASVAVNPTPTVSGATVTIPAGYYTQQTTKVVSSGSATAPSTISGTAASVSTGSGTLTLTKTVSVTPTVSAGYISSGTAGNSSVSLTANVTVNPALTVSGPTVTAPAGYYTESASKSVATMTPPSEPSNNYTSGYTRLDVVDRATSTRYINIPPGYNSTGVYYQISAVYDGSATTPATTITANPTITINSSGLITATASASQSITPTVSAGYVSSGTAGTITVSGSKTQQLTTKAAATITPTTTNQTIASGTYLTGTQTILGDANLVGPNIVAGASIFNINGTATFQNYYTGSSAPASSLGNNGDIYLQE